MKNNKKSLRGRINALQLKSLVLFFLVTALLFYSFFAIYMREIHRRELIRRAEVMALELPLLLAGEPARPSMGVGQGQMGGGMRMGNYFRFLDDIAQGQTWVVDRNADSVFSGRSSRSVSELPAEAKELIEKVYTGQTATSTVFRGMLEGVSTTVGVPVRDASGAIVAALLLHGSQQVQMNQILPVLGILLGALLLSLSVSTLFGRRFARSVEEPLSGMSVTAQRLRDGDYTSRCQYRADDEIGKLAENLDELAFRLQKSKEDSEAQEELRREFLASISHELRTPITVIRGSLETLSDGIVEEPNKVKEYSRHMLTEIIQLERLVSDLMDLTRMQNASFALTMQEVQLSDILSDSVRSMRQIASEKQVEIVLHPLPPTMVTADYTRLKQMFTAVLDNAIKFSDPGDVIQLKMTKEEKEEGRIIVEIADEGAGIAEEELPFIFERFYTRSHVKGVSGTGLGLSIAKTIADRHNISLNVQSTMGKGTTFTFQIPFIKKMPE